MILSALFETSAFQKSKMCSRYFGGALASLGGINLDFDDENGKGRAWLPTGVALTVLVCLLNLLHKCQPVEWFMSLRCVRTYMVNYESTMSLPSLPHNGWIPSGQCREFRQRNHYWFKVHCLRHKYRINNDMATIKPYFPGDTLVKFTHTFSFGSQWAIFGSERRRAPLGGAGKMAPRLHGCSNTSRNGLANNAGWPALLVIAIRQHW